MGWLKIFGGRLEVEEESGVEKRSTCKGRKKLLDLNGIFKGLYTMPHPHVSS